jgi:hypothetical protein
MGGEHQEKQPARCRRYGAEPGGSWLRSFEAMVNDLSSVVCVPFPPRWRTSQGSSLPELSILLLRQRLQVS